MNNDFDILPSFKFLEKMIGAIQITPQMITEEEISIATKEKLYDVLEQRNEDRKKGVVFESDKEIIDLKISPQMIIEEELRIATKNKLMQAREEARIAWRKEAAKLETEARIAWRKNNADKE